LIFVVLGIMAVILYSLFLMEVWLVRLQDVLPRWLLGLLILSEICLSAVIASLSVLFQDTSQANQSSLRNQQGRERLPRRSNDDIDDVGLLGGIASLYMLAGIVAQIIWSYSQVQWNGPFYILPHFVITIALVSAEFVVFQMVAQQWWIPQRQAMNVSTCIRRVGRILLDTGLVVLFLLVFVPLAFVLEEGLVYVSYRNFQWYATSIELKWHNFWLVGGMIHLEMLGCTLVTLILVTRFIHQGPSSFSWIQGVGISLGFVGWYAAVAGLVFWSSKLRVSVLNFIVNLLLSFVLSCRSFACFMTWHRARLPVPQEEVTEEAEPEKEDSQTIDTLSTEIEVV